MKAYRWLLLGIPCLAVCACGKPQEPAAQEPAKPTATTTTATKKPTPEVSGRAAVQHGFDADIAKVNRTPQKITVEQLLAMRKKVSDDIELSSYPNKRVAPFETSTFEIEATIKSIKHEKDGDFYFVIQGDSGAQAVVEVPDPSLCTGSPMLADIQKARQALDDKFHPTETDQVVNEKATIVGVGYLGSRKKKGSGSFGGSARLMPGTGISFPDHGQQ